MTILASSSAVEEEKAQAGKRENHTHKNQQQSYTSGIWHARHGTSTVTCPLWCAWRVFFSGGKSTAHFESPWKRQNRSLKCQVALLS